MNASTMLSMNGIFSITSNLFPFVPSVNSGRALSLACPEPSRRVEGLPQSFRPNSHSQSCREISHGNTRVNRPAFRLFGGGFLLCHLEHFRGAYPRDEAHTRIVGEYDIAWGDSNAGNL